MDYDPSTVDVNSMLSTILMFLCFGMGLLINPSAVEFRLILGSDSKYVMWLEAVADDDIRREDKV